jgi:hypothetical protein
MEKRPAPVRAEALGVAAHENVDAGLDAITSHSQQEQIGTLSFPVNGKEEISIHKNTLRIEEIVRRRGPSLLLCAGWSVPTIEDLESITAVTKKVKTVVVLEVAHGTTPEGAPLYFRICGGKESSMKEQVFSNGKNANADKLCGLGAALPDRSFTFLDRQAILLVCGEITVMRGRPPEGVGFRVGVPNKLVEALRAPGVMILNPTHTRMRRAFEVNAWRKYLSCEGRTYVSASNWDLAPRGKLGRPAQCRPSGTLHALWHDGREQRPVQTFENEFLCYREWHLPKL